MYKAVFFDFDGVITENEAGIAPTLQYLSELTGRNVQELSVMFAPLEALSKAGKLPLEQLATELSSKAGVPITVDNLNEAFLRTRISSPMMQLARRIRANYKTGIITDNIPERFKLPRSPLRKSWKQSG